MSYYYEIRRKFIDDLIEESEEFDTYEEAQEAAEECLFQYVSGADALEGSGRDYIDEDEMYFEIKER